MTKPRSSSYFRTPETKPSPDRTPSRSGTTPDARKSRPDTRPAARNGNATPGKTSAPRPGGPGFAKAIESPRPAATNRPSRPSGATPRPTPPKPASPTFPGALINRRAADRLRQGYLWVYASDIESIQADAANPPALLPVADSRGLLLGTALYSPTSQIALRLVSREALDEPGWLALLATRLSASIERRLPALKLEGNDSARLCFSEADDLPGLVIDKYGPLVVVQRLARGLNTPAVAEVCVRILRDLLNSGPLAPKTILERPDPRIRELEGLPAPDLNPLWAENPAEPLTGSEFHLNGLVFHYDANSGQKTGAFLDQSANYLAAQRYAEQLTPGGRVPGLRARTLRALDVCTYQGGFALHLARVCARVTGIDASHSSLEVAERNLGANRSQLTAEVDWVAGDAFNILRDWSGSGAEGAGEKFDVIVLDPPAFAKSQRAVEGALRGYKELNLRALKMLNPGGLLITCSCSHHVSWADLEGAVAAAAIDAARRVRLLERRGPAHDHPVVLNLPETEYLKCLILQVD